MKGCGKRFVPRPQNNLRAKYCPACRGRAAKWSAWLRRRKWRRSPAGKSAKQRENQRYRKKHPKYHTLYRNRNLERVREIERASKQRCRSRNPAGGDVHKGVPWSQVPCRRPGCYTLFLTLASLTTVRFYCGPSCRTAMRRFSSLLAQLRYRKTTPGNYRRKLSRSQARSPP